MIQFTFAHIKTTNPNTSLKKDGFGFMLYGASNRARTCDTAVNSRVLCQLSY